MHFVILPSSFFLRRVRGEEGETKEVTLATAFSEHFFFSEKRDTAEYFHRLETGNDFRCVGRSEY